MFYIYQIINYKFAKSNICQENSRHEPRRAHGSSLAAAAIGQLGLGSYGM